MSNNSAIIGKRGKNLPGFAETKAELGLVARNLRARNRAVFLEQLKFGLWLLYAKAQANRWNREMRMLARRVNRSLGKGV